MCAAVLLSAAWYFAFVAEPFCQPASNFSLHLRELPRGVTAISLLALDTQVSYGSYAVIAALADGTGTVSGSGLPPATYAVITDTGEAAEVTIQLHDSAYTLVGLAAADGGPLQERLSVAGGTVLRLMGSFFQSRSVVVRFADSTSTVDMEGAHTSDGYISVTTPVWPTPTSWWDGCTDADRSAGSPVRSEFCVPDLPAKVCVSLDGGATFTTSQPVQFGWVRPLRIAFVYVGPITDFGWTYSINKGRLHVESTYGGLVDATTYVENVPEGEYVGEQANKGATLATGTAVSETFDDGTLNDYYPMIERLKSYCDEDYDLVFAASFGFMAQTIDVSGGYPPCAIGKDGNAHETHFVHVAGHQTNSRTSTVFGMIYQARYLAGLVAGDALAAAAGSPHGTPRGNSCVGYIAAFPIPEVQRGINAFALGCRQKHSACVVKVMWTGTWHSDEIEGAAAHFFWHQEQCDLITQHSDTAKPQEVYSANGGLGVGYNADVREVVGDSVLTAPMLKWGPMFERFVAEKLRGAWTPEDQPWLGFADAAVDLAPFFSPKVAPATVVEVMAKRQELIQASGRSAFHHIFCGPLRKQWAYDFADGDSGQRAKGCGFQPVSNPIFPALPSRVLEGLAFCPRAQVWRRLEVPEQINLKHYRDADGNPLPDGLTEPRQSDCLWGMDWPGEALLSPAYPDDFDEDYVFSDYLVEGVELLQPRETPNGTIHDASTHGCDGGPTGDRFFSLPPKPQQESIWAWLTPVLAVLGIFPLGGFIIGVHHVRYVHTAKKRRLRLAAEELAQAEQKQKQLEQDFFAMTCHEIRNPLNGLVGCLRLAASLLGQLHSGGGALPDAEQQSVSELLMLCGDARLCGEQALQVLANMTSLQRLEAGLLDPVRQPTPLTDIIAKVAAILRPQLHAGVTLCERLTGCDGQIIDTNPMMLVQILTNLAQNAAKHTNAGFVELRACATATETPDVISLELAVRDSGPGLTGTSKLSCFSKYTTTSGTGLGLYLTKLQTELLGGSIEVNSPWTAEHTGAEFRVMLPACPVTNTPAPQPVRPPAPVFRAGAHVLLADDIRVNRALLTRAFTRRFGEDWTVQEANTAEEALEALHSGHAFDLLIMDEIFSDMDGGCMRGSTAIKLLREREASEGLARLAVISCTGAASHQASQYLDSGADLVWNKPFPNAEDGTMQLDIAKLLPHLVRPGDPARV